MSVIEVPVAVDGQGQWESGSKRERSTRTAGTAAGTQAWTWHIDKGEPAVAAHGALRDFQRRLQVVHTHRHTHTDNCHD